MQSTEFVFTMIFFSFQDWGPKFLDYLKHKYVTGQEVNLTLDYENMQNKINTTTTAINSDFTLIWKWWAVLQKQNPISPVWRNHALSIRYNES